MSKVIAHRDPVANSGRASTRNRTISIKVDALARVEGEGALTVKVRNGALKVIPGSHRAQIDRGRLDSVLFLRPELEENRKLIEQARTVELEAGDTLFFHCRLFHAAGMNLTDDVKLSAVFTYHTDDNQPIPATRSAQLPSIPLG